MAAPTTAGQPAQTPTNPLLSRGTKDVDLVGLYAKHMDHHGCGKGLYLPVSTTDLSPPCCGFWDRNGDWNLISNLEFTDENGSLQQDGYIGLKAALRDVAPVHIKWQPKTSRGVKETSIDTSGGVSTNVAGGADAHIKYKSRNKFGAVLMTTEPVVLKAFHQERMFMQWLEDNKQRLHEEYGSQLRKYGLWIVTKTYSSHGASINAWYSDDKDILVSIAAKANMLGELKGELDQSDKVMDKDWSHYSGNGKYTMTADDERVVVFADGIEIKPSYWWLKGLEYSIPGSTKSRSPGRIPAITRTRSEETHPTPLQPISETQPVPNTLSPPSHPQPQSQPQPQPQPQPQIRSRPRQLSENRTSTLIDERYYNRTTTTPSTPQQRHTPSPSPPPPPVHEDPSDEHILQDAFGGQTSLLRAASIRSASRGKYSRSPSLSGDTSNNISPSSRLSAQTRTPSRGSLRRDSRDISDLRKDQNRLSTVSYDSVEKGLGALSWDDIGEKGMSGVIRDVGTDGHTGFAQ